LDPSAHREIDRPNVAQIMAIAKTPFENDNPGWRRARKSADNGAMIHPAGPPVIFIGARSAVRL
jgi:hypothetical protein